MRRGCVLFNSYIFIFVFLPVFLVLYWGAKKVDSKKLILVLASYIFYGAWSIKFAFLMLGTTSVDYFTAKNIERAKTRRAAKAWLVVSLASNLGVLGVFKYYDFFAGSLNAVLGKAWAPLVHVVLPIGISFYTFESMSYTIDVYRGRIAALTRFLDYAHFVTMFPRLIAGPIVRYADLATQLRSAPARLDAGAVSEAIHFFVLGLAKKVLIADWLAAHLVDRSFATPANLQCLSAWAAALGYTGQLYFDFSGYSDMAVGLGLLVGFRLPRNFNLPYQAASIQEFWRRWHISLSTWLRDYLYVPLGGNRKGPARTQLNTLLTMLLGGLWHGANWTFILWGAYHGIGLVISRALRPKKPGLRALAVASTFVFVVLGWVLFRSESFGAALEMYRSMAGFHGLGLAWARANAAGLIVLAIALGIAFTWDTPDVSISGARTWGLAHATLAVLCVLRLSQPSPFLYFQF